MRRLERLFNLVAALLDTERPLGRNQLHERVPGYADEPVAFRRAFERDKETLRAMGIPLLTVPLDPDNPELGDGYRIPREQYEMPDPGLTVDELTALHVAASVVDMTSGRGTATAALWKLGGAPGTVPAMEGVELPKSDNLEIAFSAVSERRRLSFTYKGRLRSIDPHRLSFRNGHWYLNGFDHDHADVRSFRVDRVEGAMTAGDANAFSPPPPVTQPRLAPWQMGEEAPVEARVCVDAEQADWVIGQVGPDAVEERRPDGSVVVTMEVTNREALRSFVLGLLDHAEILSPQELRDDMVIWLRQLLVTR